MFWLIFGGFLAVWGLIFYFLMEYLSLLFFLEESGSLI